MRPPVSSGGVPSTQKAWRSAEVVCREFPHDVLPHSERSLLEVEGVPLDCEDLTHA